MMAATCLVGQERPKEHGLRIVPPPPPNFRTYGEGLYDIHVCENLESRGKPKSERSVLILGMFSDKDAVYESRRLVNPATGRKYDVIIGLGASGRDIEVPDDSPTLTEKARSRLKQAAVVGRELARVILKDHVAADENAEALKAAVTQYFGGPLEARTIDTHSNGTTVGITALTKGVFKGVSEVRIMGPDVGYGGLYLDSEHLSKLKQAGVAAIDVYRMRDDIVPMLAEVSASLPKAVPHAKLAEKLRGAVAAMMDLSVASGEAVPDAPTVRYHEFPSFGLGFQNHYVENYISVRAGFVRQDGQVPAGGPDGRGGAGPPVKGVRLYIDDRVLTKVLTSGTPEETGRLLESLGGRLAGAGSDTGRDEVLAGFAGELALRLRGTKSLRRIDNLVAVSVKSLVGRSEKFADRWGDLPEEVRHPGGISRIHGYILDPDHGDILILGRREPGAPPIDIDDLIVAVRWVWKELQTPSCSLEPDRDNFSGDQNCRVAGVPGDSLFALKMLQADYLMKKIMWGLEEVGVAGYASYRSILRKNPPDATVANRFWLYPIQPDADDIQVSSDGRCVVFAGGVQVLSEQMELTRQGLIGSGKLFGPAEEAAASFTRHYEEIAKVQRKLAELASLNDMILLARIWRGMNVESSLLDRLAGLPHRPIDVPRSYPGIRVVVLKTAAGEAFLEGGVQFQVGVGGRAWLVADAPDVKALRDKAGVTRPGEVLSFDLAGATVNVPEPSAAHGRAGRGAVVAALSKLGSGDLKGAGEEALRAVRADPGDPEALSVRALVRFHRGELEATRIDARRARQIDPDNPRTALLTSVLLFQCDAMEGKTEGALIELERALRADPSSPRAHVLRGEAYIFLGRAADARTELHQAIAIDPGCAAAYAQLAVLELSQGWVVKGRNLAKKALALAPDAPEAKAALAMVEVSLDHGEEADRLALEVINHPACDPASRFQALTVRMLAAAMQGRWDKADGFLRDGRRVAPLNPAMLVFAAAVSKKAGQDDRAGQYMDQAERIAPNHPAVRMFREKYGKRGDDD